MTTTEGSVDPDTILKSDPRFKHLSRFCVERNLPANQESFNNRGDASLVNVGDGTAIKLPTWLIDKICTCPIGEKESVWLFSNHRIVDGQHGPKHVIMCTKCHKLWSHFAYAFIIECGSCEELFVNFPWNKYELCEGCDN